MLASLLIAFHLIVLVYFCFFAFYNYYYAFASLLYKRPRPAKIPDAKVAVVIVSYNEGVVLEDTIQSCEQLTYKNKTIIVGDDSNDGVTYEILKNIARTYHCRTIKNKYPARVEVYQSPHFVLFHRKTNDGFKAGNLKELEVFLKNHGFDYMYLLDADWHPQPDTLERCLEVIAANPKLAYVQTKRVSCYNTGNHLERCLALNENGCYFVDLPGRHAAKDPVLFTGCCTLFRLSALYDVNGFKPGHLTEDIDLTNRFYLHGYKAAYLPYVRSEGEVPPHYEAVRKQQERWTMGSARTLRDYFWPILRSTNLNTREKLALMRQNGYFASAVVIELSILSSLLSLIFLTAGTDSLQAVLYRYYLQKIGGWYTIALFLALVSNFVPQLLTCIRHNWKDLFYIPYATWLSWSLLHTYFFANIKGFFGHKANWFKTPKHNRTLTIRQRNWSIKTKLLNSLTLIGLLAIYAIEWTQLGWADPYAYLWIPALVIAIVFS